MPFSTDHFPFCMAKIRCTYSLPSCRCFRKYTSHKGHKVPYKSGDEPPIIAKPRWTAVYRQYIVPEYALLSDVCLPQLFSYTEHPSAYEERPSAVLPEKKKKYLFNFISSI